MEESNRPELVPELACNDAQASRRFYVDVLGFSVLYERPDQGFCYLVRGGVELMLEQTTKLTWATGELAYPLGRGMHFQIMTGDVERLYRRCLDAGVRIFRELEDAWYRADDEYVGQRQFVILDPDGFMLRFAEELGRRPQPPAEGRSVA